MSSNGQSFDKICMYELKRPTWFMLEIFCCNCAFKNSLCTCASNEYSLRLGFPWALGENRKSLTFILVTFSDLLTTSVAYAPTPYILVCLVINRFNLSECHTKKLIKCLSYVHCRIQIYFWFYFILQYILCILHIIWNVHRLESLHYLSSYFFPTCGGGGGELRAVWSEILMVWCPALIYCLENGYADGHLFFHAVYTPVEDTYCTPASLYLSIHL